MTGTEFVSYHWVARVTDGVAEANIVGSLVIAHKSDRLYTGGLTVLKAGVFGFASGAIPHALLSCTLIQTFPHER